MSKDNKKTAVVRKAVDKKSKMNKIIAISVLSAAAVAFVVFIVIILVTQIGIVRPIKSTKEELKVVGTVDGEEICYDELRYVAKLYQMTYEKRYGENIWSDSELTEKYREELERDVIGDITDLYAVISACKSLGINTDSKEAERAAQDAVEKVVDEDFGGSMKEYKNFLAENGLTDRFLRFMCEINYLETLATETLADNAEYVKYGDDNYLDFLEYVKESGDYARTVHVYLSKVSEDSAAAANKLERAQEIAAELAAVADDEERYEAMRKYIGSTDFVEGVSIGTLDGIYFTKGQMGEVYEEAAFALGEYETSGVIETDDGYYVIMRLPKEEDYITANGTVLLSNYRNAAWVVYKREYQGSAEFVPNEYFDSLDLTQIK